MRLSYRSSMLESIGSNVTVLTNESPIDMNLRPSLDLNRLVDPDDSYTTMLGLPDQRQAHRSVNV
jgi:hypothetical protein